MSGLPPKRDCSTKIVTISRRYNYVRHRSRCWPVSTRLVLYLHGSETTCCALRMMAVGCVPDGVDCYLVSVGYARCACVASGRKLIYETTSCPAQASVGGHNKMVGLPQLRFRTRRRKKKKMQASIDRRRWNICGTFFRSSRDTLFNLSLKSFEDFSRPLETQQAPISATPVVLWAYFARTSRHLSPPVAFTVILAHKPYQMKYQKNHHFHGPSKHVSDCPKPAAKPRSGQTLA